MCDAYFDSGKYRGPETDPDGWHVRAVLGVKKELRGSKIVLGQFVSQMSDFAYRHKNCGLYSYDVEKIISKTVNMEHLYLMDDDNFLYEHMANLRPGVVDLIQRNVCAMIDAGRKIHVQSADAVPNEEFEQRIKYTEDPGLWDKLINEYNAKHPDKILERWTRN